MATRISLRTVMRRGLAALAAALLGVVAQTAAAEDLRPFKNWFLTGDYATAHVQLGGRGVGGLATGYADLRGRIPRDAEIVAAYLYWTAVAENGANPRAVAAGARFRRNDISTKAVLVESRQNVPAQCGGDWRFSSSRATYVFRADVLRYFPRFRDPGAKNPVLVDFDALHEVTLPDGGSDSLRTSTLGAGLVVVWRRAGYQAPSFENPVEPLRGIVLYEGAATLNSQRSSVAATLRGFYEASAGAPNARLSMFVAQSQSSIAERIRLQPADAATVIGTGLLGGTQPGYTAVNFGGPNQPALPLPARAMEARVSIEAPGTNGTLECLTWSTAILSTEVQDRDLDGLLDIWESRAQWASNPYQGSFYSSWPLTAFASQPRAAARPVATPLPDLEAMGARPDVQDLFVQVDYMKDSQTGRSHAPSAQALEWVATAFRNAAPRPSLVKRGLCPRTDGTCPINVWFDVAGLYTPNSLRPGTSAPLCPSGSHCPFLPAGAGIGIGGLGIEEESCTGRDCAFPAVQGTVGWKNGFRALRDGIVDEAACLRLPLEQRAGARVCESRFPAERNDIFRYALFARALGVPSLSDPTQPRRSSGVADTNGGDLMVTLGLWGDGPGSAFIQASTLKHELGHTLGLRHGGIVTQASSGPGESGTTIGLNCRPNYQSLMNYLFQVGGLRDANGDAQLAYSGQTLIALDETRLDETVGLIQQGTGVDGVPRVASAFLPRWYAPQSSSFLDRAVGTTPVARRCDGTPVSGGTPYVRIDAPPRTRSGDDGRQGLDWNADGTVAGTRRVDSNFDGVPALAAPEPPVAEPLASLGAGANDFATMDLRQVGGRRAIGGELLSRSVIDPRTGRLPGPTEPAVGGGLSLGSVPTDYLGYGDLGYGDLGYGDLGYGDLGYGDLGYGDLGYGDLGYGDLGYGDLGYGDLGYGDLGYGDLGYGDLGVPAPEPVLAAATTTVAPLATQPVAPPLGPGGITLETAVAISGSPPQIDAQLVPGGVVIRWQPPVVGKVLEYQFYRVLGSTVTPANTADGLLDRFAAGPPSLFPHDELFTSVLVSGTYTFFVVAVLENPDFPGDIAKGIVSGASNFVTRTVEAPLVPCVVRLAELVASQRLAIIGFPGTDPGQLGNGLRLTPMGRLTDARGVNGSVWRIRNASAQTRTVTLATVPGTPRNVAVSQQVTIPPNSEAFVFSTARDAAHRLTFGGLSIDQAASPSTFAISRPVVAPRCRRK